MYGKRLLEGEYCNPFENISIITFQSTAGGSSSELQEGVCIPLGKLARILGVPYSFLKSFIEGVEEIFIYPDGFAAAFDVAVSDNCAIVVAHGLDFYAGSTITVTKDSNYSTV